MNLRQLEFFVHVAEAGSFSRASALMGLTQPAVSRQVSALESELRFGLLHRNGRGVLLTDAGQRFLMYARGILHQLEGARHAVTGNETDLAGKVAIGLPPSLGQVLTLPVVKAFRQRYPNAELAIMEALSVALQERLLAGRLDAAVIHNPLPTPLVRIEPVLTESLCLLSPARGTRGRSVDFHALSKFELIFPGAPHPIRSLVEAEALRRSVELRVVLEIDAIAISLQLVAEGYGHAVVPYNVVRAGMSGAGVVARPIVRPTLESTVALIVPARRPSTLLADGAADILRRVLRQTLRSKRSSSRRQIGAIRSGDTRSPQ
jgi:LysR family transcriptional regulator, nitrogen assimilation regulatory protein